MLTRLALAALLLAPLLLASPAHALRCREWTPLAGDQRSAVVRREVQAIVSSNKARGWEINMSRIKQCMVQSES